MERHIDKVEGEKKCHVIDTTMSTERQSDR